MYTFHFFSLDYEIDSHILRKCIKMRQKGTLDNNKLKKMKGEFGKKKNYKRKKIPRKGKRESI